MGRKNNTISRAVTLEEMRSGKRLGRHRQKEATHRLAEAHNDVPLGVISRGKDQIV
jgi:hypothetical protein